MRSNPYPFPSMDSYHHASARSRPHTATNPLAVASLVLGVAWLYWIGSVLAVVAGHTALWQIRRAGGRQQGGNLAIAGITLGWLGLAVLALLVVF